MVPMRCPETSVNNYHLMPRNIPEEGRSQYSVYFPKLKLNPYYLSLSGLRCIFGVFLSLFVLFHAGCYRQTPWPRNGFKCLERLIFSKDNFSEIEHFRGYEAIKYEEHELLLLLKCERITYIGIAFYANLK